MTELVSLTEKGKNDTLQTDQNTVFFNIKGIWHHDYLTVVQTANHYFYKDVLEL